MEGKREQDRKIEKYIFSDSKKERIREKEAIGRLRQKEYSKVKRKKAEMGKWKMRVKKKSFKLKRLKLYAPKTPTFFPTQICMRDHTKVKY